MTNKLIKCSKRWPRQWQNIKNESEGPSWSLEGGIAGENAGENSRGQVYI